MSDIVSETCDVVESVVAAVEAVNIEDKESVEKVEGESAAAVEKETKDCENEVPNTSEEEEKQGEGFIVFLNIIIAYRYIPTCTNLSTVS